MAWSYVGKSTATTGTSSGTSLAVFGLPAFPQVGDTLFHVSVFDNTGTTTPTVVGANMSKPAGETNVWTKVAYTDSPTATSSGGVRSEIWALQVTSAWSTSSIATAELSAAVTARGAVALVFSGGSLTPRTVSLPVSGTTGTGSASRTSTVTGVVTGDLAIGVAATESNAAPTTDADTTGGAWTGSTFNTASGGAAANIGGNAHHKIVSSSATQSLDCTVSDGGVVLIALQPAALAAAIYPTIRVSNPAHRRSYTW